MNLPPTSSGILDHIKRWWYLVKVTSTLLDDSPLILSPLDHGWVDIEDELMPEKNFNIIPEHFTCKCQCNGDCTSKRCGCRNDDTICTQYCLCGATCKNNVP